MLRILINLALFAIGVVAGGLFLMSAICLRFGIPTARAWYQAGCLKTQRTGYYAQSALLTLFTGLAITAAVYLLAPTSGLASALSGTALCLLMGVFHTGANEANLKDFMERNAEYIDPERLPPEQAATFEQIRSANRKI